MEETITTDNKHWFKYTDFNGKNELCENSVIQLRVTKIFYPLVVFRNLCHFSIIKKIGMTHDSIFRLQ